MNNPLVTVIIVNYNGMRFLKDCLRSLSKVTYKKREVFFVDNASVDDSVFYLKKNFPDIRIIQNKKNLGFAGGHEGAFKKAKGEAILLLSTDTIVEKNLLDVLIEVLYSKKNIGAVMPKLVMYPQKELIDSIGAFFSYSGILYHFGREKDEKNPMFNKSMEIYSAKGACILFRKEVLDKTGLFDKDYFAYFEETDLCHRAWLAGYRILYTPKNTVCHVGGGASKQIVPAFIQFHAYKNRIDSYLKNLSVKYLVRVIPATIFLYECASLAYLLKGQFSLFFAIQRSVFWNIMNIKKILKKRKFVQEKIRVRDDDDFLPGITRSVRLSYYYYIIFKGLKYYKE